MQNICKSTTADDDDAWVGAEAFNVELSYEWLHEKEGKKCKKMAEKRFVLATFAFSGKRRDKSQKERP